MPGPPHLPSTTLFRSELPNRQQRDKFVWTVTRHTMVHEQLARLYTGFRRDSHPMAVLVGVVGALSAFYHDSLDINNPDRKSTRLNSSHLGISYAVFCF